MPPPRRLWCSCAILYYLAGRQEAHPDCQQILDQGERGQLEIMVSVLAEAEVAKLEGGRDDDAELRIREFFGRNYVIRAGLEVAIAREARRLVRTYAGIKPLDAVHIATALHHKVPILETYDTDMMKISGKEGDPPLTIQRPTYDAAAISAAAQQSLFV